MKLGNSRNELSRYFEGFDFSEDEVNAYRAIMETYHDFDRFEPLVSLFKRLRKTHPSLPVSLMEACYDGGQRIANDPELRKLEGID